MNRTPASLLRGGHIFARLGSLLASAAQQEKVARALLAKASHVIVVQEDERTKVRVKTEYPDGTSIPRTVLCGQLRRAIFGYYPTLDWEWFTQFAHQLYLPSVVLNPRTMFSGSRSAFETMRRSVAADHLDLVVALGETNPLEFAVFCSCAKSASRIYRILSVEAKVPKKWSRFGGLPER
jgi:hypothetical protein